MTLPLPTRAECFALWDVYHTPENVRRHLLQVANIALWLGKARRTLGDSVDLALVEAGALLHDLLRLVGEGQIQLKHFREAPTYEDLEKWRELNLVHPGLGHAAAAAAELRKLGYPEPLLGVILAHDFSRILDPDLGPKTLEQKIVYYADKRVRHDEIVTLAERLADGKERYPEWANRPDQKLRRVAVFELERELFDGLGIEADDLTEEVVNSL